MKRKFFVFMITLVIGLTIFACSPQQTQSTPISTSTNAPTVTMPSATATIPLVTQEPVTLPFSEPGPYYVGKWKHTIVDESRNNRQIQITIWYPALEQTDDDGRTITLNAEPDLSKAPYPLILTDPQSDSHLFHSHLATHGFVMVIVDPPEFSNTMAWNNYVIDAPLDFLFALDMLTFNPPEGLGDILDTNRVGVGGYSSG